VAEVILFVRRALRESQAREASARHQAALWKAVAEELARQAHALRAELVASKNDSNND